ncbi:hypothetical protein VP01_1612g10 [Puccinia sorghi]|uniref:Uncharacterized protein n=1 Tax=Puccinia sorghi TaxID=27349 RepID=A0A0L6VHP6_9BASI|nr:hypothetical protein VP01_1612g10 [Puccinia sorghi]
MLFKYLVAPIALAAATAGFNFGRHPESKGIDFSVVLSVTEEAQGPIRAQCAKENVPAVVKDLSVIYVRVDKVSEKLHTAEKLEKNFLVRVFLFLFFVACGLFWMLILSPNLVVQIKQATIFFQFLFKFEGILRDISQHPKVSKGCHEKITEFNSKFDVVVQDIKKHDIEIKRALAGFTLDLSLWSSLGFKFQNQLGIHN